MFVISMASMEMRGIFSQLLVIALAFSELIAADHHWRRDDAAQFTDHLSRSPSSVCTEEARMYPHPRDCTKFTRCVNQRLVTFSCPPLTAFDPEAQVCAWRVGKNGCGGKLGLSATVWAEGLFPQKRNNDVEFQKGVPYIGNINLTEKASPTKGGIDSPKTANRLTLTDTQTSGLETKAGRRDPIQDLRVQINKSHNSSLGQKFEEQNISDEIGMINESRLDTQYNKSNHNYEERDNVKHLDSRSGEMETSTTSYSRHMSISGGPNANISLLTVTTESKNTPDRDKQDMAAETSKADPSYRESHNESLRENFEERASSESNGEENVVYENVYPQNTKKLDFDPFVTKSRLLDSGTDFSTIHAHADTPSSVNLSTVAVSTSFPSTPRSTSTGDRIDADLSKTTVSNGESSYPHTTKPLVLRSLHRKSQSEYGLKTTLSTPTQFSTHSFRKKQRADTNPEQTHATKSAETSYLGFDHITTSAADSSNFTVENLLEWTRYLDELLNSQIDANDNDATIDGYNTTSMQNDLQEIFELLESGVNLTTTTPLSQNVPLNNNNANESSPFQEKFETSTNLTSKTKWFSEATTAMPSSSPTSTRENFSFIKAIPYLRPLGDMGRDSQGNVSDIAQSLSTATGSSHHSNNLTGVSVNSVPGKSESVVPISNTEGTNTIDNLQNLATNRIRSFDQKTRQFSIDVSTTIVTRPPTSNVKPNLNKLNSPSTETTNELVKNDYTTETSDITTKHPSIVIRLPTLSNKNKSASVKERVESGTTSLSRDLKNKNDHTPYLLERFVTPERRLVPTGRTVPLKSSDSSERYWRGNSKSFILYDPLSPTRTKELNKDKSVSNTKLYLRNSSRTTGRRRNQQVGAGYRPKRLFKKLYNPSRRRTLLSDANKFNTRPNFPIFKRRWYGNLKNRRRKHPYMGWPGVSKNSFPQVRQIAGLGKTKNKDAIRLPEKGELQDIEPSLQKPKPSVNHKFPRPPSQDRSELDLTPSGTRFERPSPDIEVNSKSEKTLQRSNHEDDIESPVNFKSSPYIVKGLQRPFQCPAADGHFADPNNCAVFYHCDNGVAYRRDCPPGQLFHKDALACVSASIAPPCISDQVSTSTQSVMAYYIDNSIECPEPDGLYNDPFSCRHYLDCTDGRPVRRQCMRGTVFDAGLGKCTWSKFVPGCERFPEAAVQAISTPAESENDVAGQDVNTARQGPSKEIIPPETQENKVHHRSSFICQRDGFSRDPLRCDVYYLCSDGESLRLICDPGTSFDPVLNMCVWSKMVPGCDVAGSTFLSNDAQDGNNSGVRAEERREKKKATTLLASIFDRETFVCPSFHGIYSDESNCTAFIHCFQGIPFRHYCQPGTAYSQQVGACTWRYLVPNCWRDMSLTLQNKFYKHDVPRETNIIDFGLLSKKTWPKFDADKEIYNMYGFSNPTDEGDKEKRKFNGLSLSQNMVQNSETLADFPNRDAYKSNAEDRTLDDGAGRVREKWNRKYRTFTEKSQSNAPAHSLQRQGVPFRNDFEPNTRNSLMFEKSSDGNIQNWFSQGRSIEAKSSVATPINGTPFGIPVEKFQPLQSQKPQLHAYPEFRCPSVQDGFYRDAVLCDVFHRCVMGERFTFGCPPGTFFRIEGNFCDHSDIITDCNQDGVRFSALPLLQNVQPFNSRRHASSESLPLSTPKSWEFPKTMHDTKQQMMPTEGGHNMMVPQTGFSDIHSRGPTKFPQAPEPPSCPSPSGLFPHPDTCSQFLFCAHSVPLVLTCPDSLLYNARTLTCDFPANVSCPWYETPKV